MSIGDAVTRKLMRDFRTYMVVGGMPQAVSEYIESNNLQEVDRVKRGIIQLYEDDFYKIDPSGRISSLFDAIPAQLNSNASRYQVASAIGDANYEKCSSSSLSLENLAPSTWRIMPTTQVSACRYPWMYLSTRCM